MDDDYRICSKGHLHRSDLNVSGERNSHNPAHLSSEYCGPEDGGAPSSIAGIPPPAQASLFLRDRSLKHLIPPLHLSAARPLHRTHHLSQDPSSQPGPTSSSRTHQLSQDRTMNLASLPQVGVWTFLVAAATVVGVLQLARLAVIIAGVHRKQKVLGDTPGPRPLPIIGNVLELLAPRKTFWSKAVALVERFAPTFRFWCGPTCFMIITHPLDFEFILNNPKFNDKSSWYPLAQSALGTGLIILSGEQWRRHRKVVAPSMHHQVLVQNVQVFHRKALDVSAAMLGSAADSGATLDVKDFCNLLSMDAVCETILSSDLSSSRDALKRFVDAKNEACEAVAYRVYNPWLLSDRVYALTSQAREVRRIERLTDRFVDEVISTKRRKVAETQVDAAPANTTSKRKSFLEHALADEGVADLMTDEELREEAKAMVIAGEGTVATTLSFTLLMLAMHPHVQQAVVQELEDVFGSDVERPVTEDELPHLDYLERVILETLRLFPLVSVFGRDCPEDVQLPSGCSAPKGSHLLFFTFRLHRDPAWWPKPLDFDPDRFLPEQVRSRPPLSFAAFSAGPRSCIGQRYAMMYLKTVLGTVLRRYQVHRSPGDTRTVADLPLEIGVILTVDGGFPVRVTRRHAHQQKQQQQYYQPPPARPLDIHHHH